MNRFIFTNVALFCEAEIPVDNMFDIQTALANSQLLENKNCKPYLAPKCSLWGTSDFRCKLFCRIYYGSQNYLDLPTIA